MGRGHSSSQKRAELGLFLKSRRAMRSPQDLGLEVSGRRRTPGLRREEVAVHAGVGVSWYTWLEQGRDITVSRGVVCSIARTLRLDAVERNYFLRLAGIEPSPVETCDDQPSDSAEFGRIVVGWLPNPAVVIDRYWNLKASNATAQQVFGTPQRARGNLLESFFTDPAARELYPDHAAIARLTVSALRADLATHLDDPKCIRLVTRLRSASSLFEECWSRHDLTDMARQATVVQHAEHGLLQFDVRFAELMSPVDHRLVLHLPADVRTGQVLRDEPVGPADRRRVVRLPVDDTRTTDRTLRDTHDMVPAGRGATRLSEQTGPPGR